MNKPQAQAHILDQLAHGIPIQTILDPPCPQIESTDPETGKMEWYDDPDWVKPSLPDWSTVVDWLRDEAFRFKWEHARKMGAAYKADELTVLKDKLAKEHDPRMASKYKVMMEMIKTAAMWDDSKYSDRTIQEVKNTTPQTPEAVLSKIAQLERELGLSQGVVDVVAVEVKPKRVMSDLQRQNIHKALAAKAKKRAERDGTPDPGTKAGKARRTKASS